jgi:hypothetical protein
MDDFARVIAGMTSPAEFFSEENVGASRPVLVKNARQRVVEDASTPFSAAS